MFHTFTQSCVERFYAKSPLSDLKICIASLPSSFCSMNQVNRALVNTSRDRWSMNMAGGKIVTANHLDSTIFGARSKTPVNFWLMLHMAASSLHSMFRSAPLMHKQTWNSPFVLFVVFSSLELVQEQMPETQ